MRLILIIGALAVAFNRFLIVTAQKGFTYPGTKWCGPGNIATSYDDLGTAAEEDKCCRAHDLCDDALEPGQESSARGLSNPGPFSKLNCQCDYEFKQCLKRVNSQIANSIGDLYFKVQKTCFKLEYPLLSCDRDERYPNTLEGLFLRKKELLGRFIRKVTNNRIRPYDRCLNYKVDTNRPPSWQYLNLPHYNDHDDYPVFRFGENGTSG